MLSAVFRRRMRYRNSRAQSGFTLIEMIVATALLAIGVVAAMGAIGASTAATASAGQMQTAALLGQSKLNEIERQLDTLSGGDQQGDFGADSPGFHWQENVEATDYPNLFKVTVRVQWGGTSLQKERAFTTYLTKPDTTHTQGSQNGQPNGGAFGQRSSSGTNG